MSFAGPNYPLSKTVLCEDYRALKLKKKHLETVHKLYENIMENGAFALL